MIILILWLFIFLIGLAVGSFVNVVVYRLPRGRGVLGGRSTCPHCQRQIKWHDLIPLISFFVLGGRCRFCQKRLSWQYPLVELYSGFIFLASFWRFSPLGGSWAPLGGLFSIFILEVFLILFLTDLQHLVLPDTVILAGLAGAVIYKIGVNDFSRFDLSAGAFYFLVLAGIWLVSKGQWLGLGDAKLMGLIGFAFGFLPATAIFYLAVMAGGALGLVLLLTRRASLKSKLPLGSFITLSASLFVLTGFMWLERFHWESVLLIFK